MKKTLCSAADDATRRAPLLQIAGTLARAPCQVAGALSGQESQVWRREKITAA